MNTHYLEIINTVNVNVTNNYNSQQVERISGYSVQFIWTCNSTNAVVMIQASNDGENWDTIEGATCIISNNSGSKLFNFPAVYYRYFRPRIEVETGELLTLKAKYFLKGN